MGLEMLQRLTLEALRARAAQQIRVELPPPDSVAHRRGIGNADRLLPDRTDAKAGDLLKRRLLAVLFDVDFEETVYRYRFQGTVFAEREGFMVSSDFGAAIRTLTPGGFGEIVAGVYNGEGYNRAEPNNEKAFMIRGTVRPFPTGNALARGFRGTLLWTEARGLSRW